MKRLALLILFFAAFSLHAQEVQRPRLVVGLVVDQMRWDFLYRYQARYGENGFKRLLREGFSCDNTLIDFTPTYTGAGHAGIYTGSVPALNGIMGNYWYDRNLKRNYYCTEDSTVKAVGSNSAAGKNSPRNLWSNTITDELRLASNFRNKTIAIALKDRGSILPGGYTANAAYWFDNESGGWISSSFYMEELPKWVRDINSKRIPDQVLQANWNTLYPISTYVQSTPDSNRYESRLGNGGITFPHMTSRVTANKYEVFRYLPGANSFSLDMAKAAVEHEALGKSGHTDFLAVSLSTPDYSGHGFGPNSIEIEDIYLRLDRDLADFLSYLDKTVGKGQYLFFLSADHGAAHNPYFLADRKMNTGTFEESRVKKELDERLEKEFGVKGLMERWINYQVYLNNDLIQQRSLDRRQIIQSIKKYLMQQPAIANVVDLSEIELVPMQERQRAMLRNGYNQKLSGDVQYLLKPGWFENWRTGTTHGLWNPYDAHIPLIFMGWKVKPGRTAREVYMQDIAPTLAAMLRIQVPNASVGKPILEALPN